MKGRYEIMDLSLIVVTALALVCVVGLIIGHIRYGSKTIFKIVLAALITILAGWVGMVIGLEFLGGYAEFGSIAAIAVMGTFILFSHEQSEHKQ